jgi:hypothetical protein
MHTKINKHPNDSNFLTQVLGSKTNLGMQHIHLELSVQKVVLTLTSKSAEIYLSMVGAKQLMTQGLSWFRPGPYVQQWCARGTILRRTMVLAEGSYKRGGRGGRVSRSLRFD